jgi:predicted metal-binding membrane protein
LERNKLVVYLGMEQRILDLGCCWDPCFFF